MISKIDLIDAAQLENLKSILRELNRTAEILPIEDSKVSLDKIINTQRFDFIKAQQVPGWLQEIRGEHKPETEEYGIKSFGLSLIPVLFQTS